MMQEGWYWILPTFSGWTIGYYSADGRWIIDGEDEGDDNDGIIIEVDEIRIVRQHLNN